MKKKLMLLFLTIVSAVCLALGLSACETKVETDGVLKYSLNDDGGYSVVGLVDETTTEITIPATFNGLSVNIGDYAFSGCSDLETAAIENGITYIGYDAFSNCIALTNVALPNTLTAISISSFNGCISLEHIEIPENVNSIGSSAFHGCSSLTEITIPNNVLTIGGHAFNNCSSLTTITIGKSVTSIGSSAFSGCLALSQIYFNATAMDDLSTNNFVFDSAGQNGEGITLTIGTNVTKIPAYMFCPYESSKYAPQITKIEFEQNSKCESIGSHAFYYCKYLEKLTIPENIIKIGEYAFYHSSALTEINFNATEMKDLSKYNYVFSYAGRSGNGITLTIGSNVTKIPSYLFDPGQNVNEHLPKITNIIFEETSSCKVIGNSAFRFVVTFTTITIPESVTDIQNYAFHGCEGLKEIIFENTENWYRTGSNSPSGGTAVSSTIIANASTMVKQLVQSTHSYGDYYWYRSEN